MKKPRIYLDTSVFGGCFDEEFSDESKALINDIVQGKFTLVISEAILRELELEPVEAQEVLARIAPSQVELIEKSQEIEVLCDA